MLWQNSWAILITKAAVQRGFKFFCGRQHVVAETSPLQFRISSPTPIDELFLDCEMARFNLWIESEGGGCHFGKRRVGASVFLCWTSTYSSLYNSAHDHRSTEDGLLFSKINLFLQFHISQLAVQRVSKSGWDNFLRATSKASMKLMCCGNLEQ